MAGAEGTRITAYLLLVLIIEVTKITYVGSNS